MIKLVNGYVVKIDTLGYTLMLTTDKTDKHGKTVYKSLGYYSTLQSAIKACIREINREQFSKNTYSLAEAIKIIEENNKLMSDLLTERFGGV